MDSKELKELHESYLSIYDKAGYEDVDNELDEGLRKRLGAAALGAALAAGSAMSGGAAKAKGQWSGQANLRYGGTPATATDKSVSKAVDSAIAKPGSSHSASERKGKTGITGSGSINYSGSIGDAGKKRAEKKQQEYAKRAQKDQERTQAKPKAKVAPPVVQAVTKAAEKPSAKPEADRRPAPDDGVATKVVKTKQQTPYQAARARLEKQGLADAGGNAYTGSSKHVDRMTQSTDAKTRAAGGQAFRDMKLVGDANRAAREKRSTGVNRGRMVQRNGQWMKVFNSYTPDGQMIEEDMYDIILSHLLDEGYAETIEAAEAIMVNMSEEWRNSIIG